MIWFNPPQPDPEYPCELPSLEKSMSSRLKAVLSVACVERVEYNPATVIETLCNYLSFVTNLPISQPFGP